MSSAEIIILDGMVSVYRNAGDVWIYVIGSQFENELILITALSAFVEALQATMRSDS